jgi:hypothetical protein
VGTGSGLIDMVERTIWMRGSKVENLGVYSNCPNDKPIS